VFSVLTQTQSKHNYNHHFIQNSWDQTTSNSQYCQLLYKKYQWNARPHYLT